MLFTGFVQGAALWGLIAFFDFETEADVSTGSKDQAVKEALDREPDEARKAFEHLDKYAEDRVESSGEGIYDDAYPRRYKPSASKDHPPIRVLNRCRSSGHRGSQLRRP